MRIKLAEPMNDRATSGREMATPPRQVAQTERHQQGSLRTADRFHVAVALLVHLMCQIGLARRHRPAPTCSPQRGHQGASTPGKNGHVLGACRRLLSTWLLAIAVEGICL